MLHQGCTHLAHKHVGIPAFHNPEKGLLQVDWVVYRFQSLSGLLAVDNTEVSSQNNRVLRFSRGSWK